MPPIRRSNYLKQQERSISTVGDGSVIHDIGTRFHRNRIWGTASSRISALEEKRGNLNEYHALSPNRPQKLPPLVYVSEEFDVWKSFKEHWRYPDFHRARITVQDKQNSKSILSIAMILPAFFQTASNFLLSHEDGYCLAISITSAASVPEISKHELLLMRKITGLYLRSMGSSYDDSEDDLVTLFVPDISFHYLEDWLDLYGGSEPVLRSIEQQTTATLLGRTIRDRAVPGHARLLRDNRSAGKKLISNDYEIECQSVPRLSFTPANSFSNHCRERRNTKVYKMSAQNSFVDRLPANHVTFGLCIPMILERLRVSLIANNLSITLLRNVGIHHAELIVPAIMAPATQSGMDYQRLELFGDTVLKYLVSCWLFQVNPSWNEARLSAERERFIRNDYLAEAALRIKLDRFIVTRKISMRRWKAPHVNCLRQSSTEQRQMSPKILADVTESLIGAAYLNGGFQMAQRCARCFIPQIRFLPSVFRASSGRFATTSLEPTSQKLLAKMIGYSFKCPSLLEQALTHSSFPNTYPQRNYQRLEFIGDAVLDMVVVATIAAQSVELSPGRMSVIKHAAVNASLLGFFCLSQCVTVPSSESEISMTRGGRLSTKGCVHLWDYIRFNGSGLLSTLETCILRFRLLEDEINSYLQFALTYPWGLLDRLRPSKFLSDIFESILGAIFIDSGGVIDFCTHFLEKIGFLRYIKRICTHDINVSHPHQRGQSF